MKGFFLVGSTYDVAVFALFLFQMVFMDTAATIPTGAMAERWKFSSFEYFKDAEGVRPGLSPLGTRLDLYEVTATVQYEIWKGLVGRLEYRHDSANQKVFAIRAPGYVPTGKSQDTISLDLYYSFF